jgi:hypothetical protein
MGLADQNGRTQALALPVADLAGFPWNLGDLIVLDEVFQCKSSQIL